ncbi:beta-ketoacyl-ACP synthase [Campylobacter ureolyticus]|uniref:Beta-ketoacyl-ACP synthase n=1 Tax=Campylobacter ureolyticus TaxID=827 RepID=A0A2I1NC22_9BACT|nr:beta-ketoacyl-ACP synthase [Campylobacter ureolyticus]MCZ6159432.1 beta-ketoacyl-ACP synthase [Campylobacter ureolyticus]MCZ6163663.1 beta-ketoacyl-ACP synthase [Campylobacter ureolyticus]MCZ6165255.1 beta-ketoacyl-ACP synthase [Campylobacter ureolyticus]PKZ29947.1 beta-ketoacyl-ACP synthase II [Campylobacter ureolyticus]
MRRVFVTGYGLITAFGKSWQDNKIALEKKENAVKIMNEWDKYSDLNTRLAAPILNYTHPKNWTRKQTRSMGRVSEFSVEASSMAFDMAKLGDEIKDGRMGVASGSSTGSTDAVASMARLLLEGESDCNANTYIKMMPHTTAANIALFFGLKGRIIPTSSACTSASHAIGYSFEAIKYGLIDMMIAGGAEELCPSEAYVFDTLYATSTKNSTPNLTPCPFDKDRDGLVLGEGAGFLVLESEESVKKRGIVPIAEVVGFGSTSDGTHITQPNPNTMKEAMALALKSANLNPKDIKYINAHATATTLGDIAESKATNELFGENIAISSTKSYLGHTLGACGGIEAIFSIEMMRQNLFYPTINLKNIDEKCAKLNYLREISQIKTDYVMSNNFAFGGVNTSLIFKKIL